MRSRRAIPSYAERELEPGLVVTARASHERESPSNGYSTDTVNTSSARSYCCM